MTLIAKDMAFQPQLKCLIFRNRAKGVLHTQKGVFHFFDEGKIVVLLNGFQKKTQKTPVGEITKALKIKEEYYEYKRNNDSGL